MDWGALLTIVIPIAIAGLFFIPRIQKVLVAMDELGDVLEVIPRALADQKLTDAERAEIKKEVTEALAAFKAILAK